MTERATRASAPRRRATRARRGLGAVAVLGAVGLIPATAAAAPAFDDVFNGRIGYTSFQVDHDPGPGTLFNGDIFSMTPDGRDQRQLTDDPGYDAQTDWSPDGTTIAYRIRKPGSRINFEIARIPAAGGPRTIITSTPTGFASSMPSWYPDGSALLFRMSGRGTDSDIWTMSPAGADPRMLFELEGSQWYPSLSPDMSRLVFATTLSPVGDTDRGIFTAKPDGSDVKLVYDAPGVMDTGPAWSPDGRIGFESDSNPTGENPEGDREIFVVGADGTGIRQLTHNAEHDEGPAFSPDGRMIAYSSGPDQQHGDIKVMTSDGVHVRTLTTFPGRDESADWQTIPAPRTTLRCGDMPGRALRDVRSDGVPCNRARRLAREWKNGDFSSVRPRAGFVAQVDDFGGTERVVLTRSARGSRPAALIAFLSEPLPTSG